MLTFRDCSQEYPGFCFELLEGPIKLTFEFHSPELDDQNFNDLANGVVETDSNQVGRDSPWRHHIALSWGTANHRYWPELELTDNASYIASNVAKDRSGEIQKLLAGQPFKLTLSALKPPCKRWRRNLKSNDDKKAQEDCPPDNPL